MRASSPRITKRGSAQRGRPARPHGRDNRLRQQLRRCAGLVDRYVAVTAAAAVAGAAVLMSSPATARTLPGVIGAGGGWGMAEEVPGTAALNSNGAAFVTSVSCASA